MEYNLETIYFGDLDDIQIGFGSKKDTIKISQMTDDNYVNISLTFIEHGQT